MDAIIQAQLNGIETALNRLVDSIASYNPSIQAASTLLEADNELQNGLKQRESPITYLKLLIELIVLINCPQYKLTRATPPASIRSARLSPVRTSRSHPT